MQKTKLIALLKTFTKQEMKDFEKFISSPYFSPGRNLKPLFNVLKKYYPEFNSPNLTHEKIYRKLYPGKKYEKKKSEHVLQVLVSEMMSLAEKFVVYDGFESGKFGFHYYSLLADEYLDKNLLDLALKTVFRNSKFIDNDIKTTYYYFRRLDISSSISNILLLQMKPQERIKYYSKDMLYIYSEIFSRFTAFHNAHNLDKISYNLIRKGEELIVHFIKTFDPELFEKECDEDDYETKNITLIN
jgi:hypothetical protein